MRHPADQGRQVHWLDCSHFRDPAVLEEGVALRSKAQFPEQ